MGDLGGEDTADRNRLTMAPVIAGGSLHGVSIRMSVVEDLPQPRLSEVLADDGCLDGHRTGDQFGEHGRIPPNGFGGIGHHTIEDDGIGDEPAFDDLAQSRSQLLDRQCLQSGHIAHDGGRRMEGAH